MEVLIALLVLGVIIIVHELGHFLSAKYFGMPVTEFAIGMGPDVYSYQGDNTRYSFRAIPIGGFVNISGMEVDSKEEDGFNSKPAYQRFIVLFAGVFMNFIFAYIIIFTMLIFNGKGTQNEKPVIGDILKNVRAEKVLQKNDLILAING
ncbi:MAG: site-2 protease family protein, partial [Fusobacteriaceae bacterium]